MVESFLLVVLILLCLVGVALAALQLPGVWLILVSATGYDWYYQWQRIDWRWLVCLGVMAALAELLDTLAAATAARRAGATRRATIGALVGGFVGMLVLTLPVPLVGTIVGGLLGCFLGALAGEMMARDDLKAGARVGLFATLGRLVGLVGKTAAALVMAGVTVFLAITAL